jgi:hypothetical protein
MGEGRGREGVQGEAESCDVKKVYLIADQSFLDHPDQALLAFPLPIDAGIVH